MTGSDYCFAVGYYRPVEIVERLHLSLQQHKIILRGGYNSRNLVPAVTFYMNVGTQELGGPLGVWRFLYFCC
jgi:hypothetical protein